VFAITIHYHLCLILGDKPGAYQSGALYKTPLVVARGIACIY